MTRLRTFAVALSLGAAVACAEQGAIPENPAAPSAIGATNARGGGPAPDHVSLTTTIATGNDIAGDGGSYSDSSILRSGIGLSNGVYHLDLRNSQNTRKVYLNFTDNGIADSGPNGGAPLSPASGPYKVYLYVACNHSNYNQPGPPPAGNYSGNLLNLPPVPPVPPMECPMTVTFSAGGKDYILHMNSRGVSAPGTDHVNIYCAAPAASGPALCSQWQIRPSGAGGSNRARLSYQGKGNTGLVLQGDYNMSFSIDLENTTP